METARSKAMRSVRAGRYVAQPNGYRAINPTAVPPDPALQIVGELQALRSQADLALGRLDGSIRILELRGKHRRAISERLGRAAGNGHRVLEQLYDHPIVAVNQVRDWIGTAYPAANNRGAQMVDCGILRELTGQVRNRRFTYQSYIDLFHDSESDTDP